MKKVLLYFILIHLYCIALCQELERELELQVGLKQEMEVAMKLLEKDTHEKQDTLAALRLQLDQVKTLNLQMFHKAQVDASECTTTVFCPHRQTKHTLTRLFWLSRTRNERQRKNRQRPSSWRRRWKKWRRS